MKVTNEQIEDRFRKVITEKEIADLKENGFAVIDNFFQEEWVFELLEEMKYLHNKKLMHPNQ
eukprot:Pgem_evm1s19563